MRGFDVSSWNGVVGSLLILTVVMAIGVGVRLIVMFTVQQRQQRMNRQINERLKVLIAAYKVLGGSFTGNLAVDPRHLRDLAPDAESPGSDRSRRIRDAVEGALSDILLLGTEEQVELAAAAARDLAAGRPVPTQPLVASLRAFIRSALDLTPIPDSAGIPAQGPTRPGGGSGGKSGREGGARGGGGQGGGGGMAMGVGMGAGAGIGAGRGIATGDPDAPPTGGAT